MVAIRPKKQETRKFEALIIQYFKGDKGVYGLNLEYSFILY